MHSKAYRRLSLIYLFIFGWTQTPLVHIKLDSKWTEMFLLGVICQQSLLPRDQKDSSQLHLSPDDQAICFKNVLWYWLFGKQINKKIKDSCFSNILQCHLPLGSFPRRSLSGFFQNSLHKQQSFTLQFPRSHPGLKIRLSLLTVHWRHFLWQQEVCEDLLWNNNLLWIFLILPWNFHDT